MYTSKPNLLLGFNGCEKTDRDRLISDISFFKKSQEDFDWLGHGMYFWENNFSRASKWAQQKKKAGKIKESAVVGAVLDLGYCFDLLDSSNIDNLKKMYTLFKLEASQFNNSIPKNLKHPRSKDNDKTMRYLDCAVIEYMHKYLAENDEKPFDSIRALFIEGEPLYPDAGFHEKTHVQICIINPNCIKGIFLPREKDKYFDSV